MCDVILETEDATQDSCDVTGRKMAATQTSSDVTTQTNREVALVREQVTISDLTEEDLRHLLMFLDSPQLFRVRQGELICTCSSHTHENHTITCRYLQYTYSF